MLREGDALSPSRGQGVGLEGQLAASSHVNQGATRFRPRTTHKLVLLWDSLSGEKGVSLSLGPKLAQ